MLCFYHLTIDAVRLQKRVMVEYSNCRKCQKCTDFTQIHPFLALLRMHLKDLENGECRHKSLKSTTHFRWGRASKKTCVHVYT